jgi:holo-[acyl-carrier protein] synthase
VDRIRKKLDDPAFLERIFTQRERDECLGRARAEESLAARWAAKEATAKALGVGIGQFLTFQDVEVISSAGKVPKIHIHGAYSIYPMQVALSLTHTRTTAAAVVMIYPGEEGDGPDDGLTDAL